LLNVNKFYSPGQKNQCYLFCIMRKFAQCGKYFRSHAVPPYTSFTDVQFYGNGASVTTLVTVVPASQVKADNKREVAHARDQRNRTHPSRTHARTHDFK
jgi:hypothetical protein